jgi:PRTRC genetic system protein B
MEHRSNDFKPFSPMAVLTIYERNHERYLEMAPFIKREGKYQVGAQKPASQAFLNDLANTIKQENFEALKFKGLIPKNVIYFHSEDQYPTLIWLLPSHKRHLYFSNEEKIKSGIYQLPDMLLAWDDGTLYCFRLNLKGDITLDTPLYLMPLPNIYDNGRICLGNGKTKKPRCLEDVIANGEIMFFNTNFSEWYHQGYNKGELPQNLFKNTDLRAIKLFPAKTKSLKHFLANA